MSLNIKTELKYLESRRFIDDSVCDGMNNKLNRLSINQTTPQNLNEDSDSDTAEQDNETATKQSKRGRKPKEIPTSSSDDRLKTILKKSIGRSILSQRVNKNTRQGRLRKALSMPVKLNCRLPAELIQKSVSEFGITSQPRTEAMKEFIAYRRVLLESNENKSDLSCVTPTSIIAAQGKENAVIETGMSCLESPSMSPATAPECQLPRRRRLFGTPLLENDSQGARQLNMNKGPLIEMNRYVCNENSCTPINFNQNHSRRPGLTNTNVSQGYDPDSFFMDADTSLDD